MRAGGHAQMRPVIEKELLHYDILFALDKDHLLDPLTFQGGTSLRLCYGAPRFSEDLDFAGGRDFTAARLQKMKSCLERHIGERYELEVSVKEPNEMNDAAQEPSAQDIKVDRWQIRVVTAPQRPEPPKQMIRIVVVNVPAYSRAPRALRQNYDFLPDGYSDTLVMTESLDEIMADKLVAFVNSTYVRHRDIWDLRWLKQQGATINAEFLRHKLDDYRVEHYVARAGQMIERLPAIVHGKDFIDQMSRFIPLEVQQRTLLKEKFLVLLQQETTQLLKEAVAASGDC